jgi:hypothetical protein
LTGGEGEDLWVGPTKHATLVRRLKVYSGFPPEKAENDFLVEVGVRQKAWFHARGLGIERRAASSLA